MDNKEGIGNALLLFVFKLFKFLKKNARNDNFQAKLLIFAFLLRGEFVKKRRTDQCLLVDVRSTSRSRSLHRHDKDRDWNESRDARARDTRNESVLAVDSRRVACCPRKARKQIGAPLHLRRRASSDSADFDRAVVRLALGGFRTLA